MARPAQGTAFGLRGWPFIVLAGAGLLLWNDSSKVSTAGLQLPVRVVILVSGLALALFLEVMARMLETRPRLAAGYDASPEAARAILDASAGLTRVLNLAVAIFLALLTVPYTWLPGLGPRGAIGLGIAFIVAAIAWAVRSLRSVHGDLERAGRLGGLEGWNGVIYNNGEGSAPVGAQDLRLRHHAQLRSSPRMGDARVHPRPVAGRRRGRDRLGILPMS